MKIKSRTEKGSKVRNKTTVPGVLYGNKIKSIAVTADANDFAKTYYAKGKTKTFEVVCDDETHIAYIC